MSKKIAIFIRSLHKGGAEKQSILLAKTLSDFYKTFLIIFFNEGGFIQLARKHNVNLIPLEGNFLKKVYKLYNFLRKENIHALFNYLPINNVIGTIIGKLAGVHLIYGGIWTTEIKSSKLKMNLQKYLCNLFSTKIISNSYKSKEIYAKYGFKKDKIIVIHNCIENNLYPFPKKNRNYVAILSVARFTEQKDFFTAINSFNCLFKSWPSYKGKIFFHIVGYGPLKWQIIKYISDLDLSESIKVFNINKDVDPFFKKADIYLSTSIYEGMPNSIMEAMSFGLPIVATDAGDTSYLVKDGYNGYVCPIGDHKQLAEKLKLLIDNYELRRKMSEYSFNYLYKNFSMENFATRYRKLIEADEK